QHVERKIEPEAALNLLTEKLEHPPGTGPKIEQGAERLFGKRGADCILNRIVGHMQVADAVPLGGVRTEIGLRGGGARLAHRSKPRAVPRDDLVCGIETIDECPRDVGAVAVFGKTEESPCPLAKSLDQAGLGQELEVARNTRLGLPEDV